eukprot:5222667-Heterocapsa_arctica.AAC.1
MPLHTVSASAASFEGSGSGLGGFQKGTFGTHPGVYWAHWTQWAQTPEDQLTPILPVLARRAGLASMTSILRAPPWIMHVAAGALRSAHPDAASFGTT